MTRRLLPLLTGLVTLLILMALHGVVWAQGDAAPAEENAVQRLTDMAFQILTPIVTLFAIWGAHRLIAVFEKKTGFDIPQKQEEQIDVWVAEAIHLGEERSRNLIKKKSEKLKGPEKLEEGAAFVLDLAEARGWAGWTRDMIEAKLEAKLGNHRANGGKPRLDDKDSPDYPVL